MILTSHNKTLVKKLRRLAARTAQLQLICKRKNENIRYWSWGGRWM